MKTTRDAIEIIQSMSIINDIKIQRDTTSNKCRIIIDAVEKSSINKVELEHIKNQIKQLEERNYIFNKKLIELISQINSLLGYLTSSVIKDREDELTRESSILLNDLDFFK